MPMTESVPVKISDVAFETVTEREASPPPASREALFSVGDLTVSYGSVPALADVSLDDLPQLRNRLHRARPAAERARSSAASTG